jgi:hypothetical protein
MDNVDRGDGVTVDVLDRDGRRDRIVLSTRYERADCEAREAARSAKP